MHISSGITQYLRDVTFTKWTVHDCLEFLAENCAGVTSKHCEEIIAELKHQLHLIKRYFQFKEVIAFFGLIDKKLNSFQSPVSSQSMTLNGVNIDETAKVSEIVQASSSAQTNDKEDQEVDVDNNKSEDDGEVFPNSSLLGRNDTKDGTRTPPHQIIGNTYNSVVSQSSANETNENIFRGASENLTCLNDIKESLTEDEPKKTISDWVCITNTLIVVNDEDTEEVTRLKKYLYRVMLPLIESFLKPILDISASNSSEHHYWSEFRHHFFSYVLQEFAGLDWRA
ncbi:12949_t:CDS:2, partial [Funneliformis geosporum]